MDNIRHLSLVGDPGGISLEKEIDIRRGGDEDLPLHHPSHPIHLLTLQRESLGDGNIPIKREEGDIHLLLPLRQYPIVEFVTMADTREIDAVLRLYSVVIETLDNNNDNYRQIQTSLSGRRSRKDQSRYKHGSKERRIRRSASTSSSSNSSS